MGDRKGDEEEGARGGQENESGVKGNARNNGGEESFNKRRK